MSVSNISQLTLYLARQNCSCSPRPGILQIPDCLNYATAGARHEYFYDRRTDTNEQDYLLSEYLSREISSFLSQCGIPGANITSNSPRWECQVQRRWVAKKAPGDVLSVGRGTTTAMRDGYWSGGRAWDEVRDWWSTPLQSLILLWQHV